MKKLYIVLVALATMNIADAQWLSLNPQTSNSLFSVFFLNTDTGYIAGGNNTLMRTIDQGLNWSICKSNNFCGNNSIFFTEKNNGFGVDSCGQFIKTTSGDTTWTVLSSGFSPLNSMYFTDDNTGYIADDRIFKTTDGGINWIQQTPETPNLVYSINFVNRDTGFAVGLYAMLKTTNGGKEWVNQQMSCKYYDLRSVFFVNEDIGFIVGYDTIYKTTNAGEKWEKVFICSESINKYAILHSVYFTDINTGYAVGDLGTILRTTDCGNNWVSLTTNTTKPLYSVFFTNTDTGYVVGEYGTILKTTNGGCGTLDIYSQPVNSLVCAWLDTSFTCVAQGDGLLYQWQVKTGSGFINLIEDAVYSNVTSSTLKLTKPPTTLNNNEYRCLITDFCNNILVSDTVLLNINPLPDAKAGDDQTVCKGTTATLIATGGTTYLWNNGVIQGVPFEPHPDTNTFIVTVIDDNGCINMDTVIVSVESVTVSSQNKSMVCGDSVMLDPEINFSGSGSLIYSWSPSTGLSNTNIANPKAGPTTSITYTISVTTPNGCTATSNNIVTVDPLIISVQDETITCGGSVILNTTTNYTGSGALVYNWSPSTGLSNSNTSNPTANPVVTTTYTVTVTTDHGSCTATKGITVSLSPLNTQDICIVSVSEDNKNIIVWEKPVSTVIDSFYIYRESTSQTNLFEKIGTRHYDSLSVFIDKLSNPDVQSNRYKISIIDKCKLETVLSSPHKTMHLTINKGMGNTWNLIWDEYEGFSVSSYRIYRGTTPSTLVMIGSTAGGNNSFSDFSAPSGDVYYQVEVLSPVVCNPSKGYNSSRSNIATNFLGIEENIPLQKINIYPNPANNTITIENPYSNTETLYSIYNMNGQEMIQFQSANKKQEITISSLPAGMYFLKVIGEMGVQVGKIIKN